MVTEPLMPKPENFFDELLNVLDKNGYTFVTREWVAEDGRLVFAEVQRDGESFEIRAKVRED